VTPHPVPGPRLADLRRSYAAGGLAEGDLAAGWPEQFERWFAEVMAAGVTEPNAVVLATASPSSGPSARTVLLKAVDARGFVVYTNLRSRKGTEALAGGRAGLCFSWVDLERQVCVVGTVEQVTVAEADAYFASRPRGSQLGAWSSDQSAVVASREVLEARRSAYASRFEGADVPRPPHWSGLRVVPETVEFWQGREDRLHDRLRFRREDAGGATGWVVERLEP